MNFSRFFVDRPIFAAVLSIVIFAVGAISIPNLPVGEYPEVVPPSVLVRTTYPGANPKEIAETVATPLEEAITGVENMMYFKSVAGSDGVLQMTITFQPGTDPEQATVRVQNRVSQALARLPEAVRRQGVTTQKQSPTFLMVVHLVSPDDSYDTLYLRNYARLHVRDQLAKISGVGEAQLFGGGDYAMRAWLDPDRIASHDLTAGDVVDAMREQNVQVSAGQIGAEPMPDSDFLTLINAKGRLSTEQEFGNIVLKVGEDGEILRLRDVARLEMGAGDYTLRSRLDGKEAVAIGIFQSPGANALQIRDQVVRTMDELAARFPPGVEYRTVYDTTLFVSDSIRSVIQTLLEAILLVVLVVTLFLQTWRASLIPLLAVPVSVVGTFAVLLLLGYSINTLTLFGLVLAIGIVVDDAIVVVENVERNIGQGLAPRAAAHRAMREVSGPIVAIGLVLCAVFVPMAFLSGVTGQFYRQFAVTIAISTVISTINSLTLSPALAAMLLKPHDAPRDRLTRVIDVLFGWLFRPFNRFFNTGSKRYQGVVSSSLRRRGAVFVVYLVLLGATGYLLKIVPPGFIPVQDKMYLIAGVKLPEGASLDRTDDLLRQVVDIAMETDGVEHAISFPGLNALQFTNTANTGLAFLTLKPFDQRTRTAAEINTEIAGKISGLKDGIAFSFMPPPILGLGNGSGYQLFIEDRGGLGYGPLQEAVTAFQGAVVQTPGMSYPITSYQANVPQLDAEVDRLKAKTQGVAVSDLFDTLQTYLGSTYINDFNSFGRTWQVIAQADAPYRDSVEDIARLRTRNAQGDMVPIGSMIDIRQSFGPDPVLRFNGYPAADLAGEADPRVLSSPQAMSVLSDIGERVLPDGIDFEWTDLSYQQSTQGNAALVVFPLAVLLVFLVLAALYESWTLPLAVILIVPMCLLSALVGVRISGGDTNVFVQVGLVVLIGLACKNAILIVEFARELEFQGRSVVEAALEACRLRLRPIIMTSITFTAAVIPLALGHGAGAEVRQALGIAVFAGMLGVTLFGLFLTPVFYVALRKLAGPLSQDHGSTMEGEDHRPKNDPA
ncbi:multidrug efflux RND transporter permease subunit [Chromohalobacter sp. HP20-39]|uniref:efflux RND transporter permease subunit n=1 Tax=Chromohalobacter sp. HP20-39 TaxID=3079306 RepID=UPI00294B5540|nr:multidrug efflux RND transporter permease subunit [Chromohalobacter sp. HP20-39]MDV6318483.1 multidrug efflux RND transporter permease subunit [Chromohalobacter sp. HP20-39]